MPTFKLRPARPKLIVRDPASGLPLPQAGKTVPRNSYWLRRVKDGDAVEIDAGGKRKPATKTTEAAEG